MKEIEDKEEEVLVKERNRANVLKGNDLNICGYHTLTTSDDVIHNYSNKQVDCGS